MQGLGEALLRGIAMGLQLPPDTFLGEFAGQEGSYWVSSDDNAVAAYGLSSVP